MKIIITDELHSLALWIWIDIKNDKTFTKLNNLYLSSVGAKLSPRVIILISNFEDNVLFYPKKDI